MWRTKSGTRMLAQECPPRISETLMSACAGNSHKKNLWRPCSTTSHRVYDIPNSSRSLVPLYYPSAAQCNENGRWKRNVLQVLRRQYSSVRAKGSKEVIWYPSKIRLYLCDTTRYLNRLAGFLVKLEYTVFWKFRKNTVYGDFIIMCTFKYRCVFLRDSLLWTRRVSWKIIFVS